MSAGARERGPQGSEGSRSPPHRHELLPRHVVVRARDDGGRVDGRHEPLVVEGEHGDHGAHELPKEPRALGHIRGDAPLLRDRLEAQLQLAARRHALRREHGRGQAAQRGVDDGVGRRGRLERGQAEAERGAASAHERLLEGKERGAQLVHAVRARLVLRVVRVGAVERRHVGAQAGEALDALGRLGEARCGVRGLLLLAQPVEPARALVAQLVRLLLERVVVQLRGGRDSGQEGRTGE